MIRGMESVMLYSQNAKKLAAFYKDVVQLTPGVEFVGGENDESYFEFKLGNCSLMIADHSKVHGKRKEPDRMFINIEVDDIEKEVARLKKHKVKIIADTYHVQDYGLIATLEDTDGNYFQFVQVRPTPKRKKSN
jgi:predicted enzyme related to lactoylglutathione lyase